MRHTHYQYSTCNSHVYDGYLLCHLVVLLVRGCHSHLAHQPDLGALVHRDNRVLPSLKTEKVYFLQSIKSL